MNNLRSWNELFEYDASFVKKQKYVKTEGGDIDEDCKVMAEQLMGLSKKNMNDNIKVMLVYDFLFDQLLEMKQRHPSVEKLFAGDVDTKFQTFLDAYNKLNSKKLK